MPNISEKNAKVYATLIHGLNCYFAELRAGYKSDIRLVEDMMRAANHAATDDFLPYYGCAREALEAARSAKRDGYMDDIMGVGDDAV